MFVFGQSPHFVRFDNILFGQNKGNRPRHRLSQTVPERYIASDRATTELRAQ
jgi:hypothetical protein